MKLYSFLLILIFVFTAFNSAGKNNFRSNDTIQANIDVDSAYSLILKNKNNPAFIILDLRTATEYNTGHIEHSVNIDYFNPDFNDILKTLNKNKTYLICCSSGGRSDKTFKEMKNLEFAKIYNMLGGTNLWYATAYPTTKQVNPILFSVTDTIINIDSIEIGIRKNINVTITNCGNDTLTFINRTNLTGTEFNTDFNINTSLTGVDEYTFIISYTPIDKSPDSIIFSLVSYDGTLNYFIHGNKTYNSIANTDIENFKLFPNPSNGKFIFNGKNISSIEIIDQTGKRIKNYDNIHNNFKIIDISNFPKGIYFAKIISNNSLIFRRIIIR
ncbi:MAG: rhodanese-like domain-containing protein [Bacteroidota bacterium]|nr:rhodanese-like domain-containing protein [Bacteroidota bacterium]